MGNHETKYIGIDIGNLLKLALVVLIFVVLFFVRDLVLVFFTALVISSFLESPILKFKKYKIPRMITVLGIFTITLVGLGILLYFLIPILFSEIASLVSVLNKIIPQESILHTFDTTTVQSTKKLFSSISNNAPLQQIAQSANALLYTLSGGIGETLAATFGSIINIVLVVVLSFYLSVQESGIENFLRIITPRKQESYVVSLWKRTETKIGLWVQGQLLLGLVMGLLVFIILSLLGVDYALILALLVLILELIPFGLILATIPAVLFAYAQGGASLGFYVLLVYLILGQIETYAVAPLITKRMVGVPPIVMILSVLIGAELAGAWGVILAIPVSVLVLEYIDDLEQSKKLID